MRVDDYDLIETLLLVCSIIPFSTSCLNIIRTLRLVRDLEMNPL